MGPVGENCWLKILRGDYFSCRTFFMGSHLLVFWSISVPVRGRGSGVRSK